MSESAVRASTQQDRLARARAALGAAEHRAARWGGQIDRTALRSIPGGAAPASSAPAPAAPSSPSSTPFAASEQLGTVLPAPEPLAALLPRGGLAAGSSLATTGAASTSLLLSLAAAAAGEDQWCAIAGMPELGVRAALEAGLDSERLALAPAGHEHTPQILSALVDGVGVLVLGPHLDLAPALWRSLQSRARACDALLLAAAPPGRADVTMSARTLGWHGLSRGAGRLRRRHLLVSSQGRGIAGSREVEVLLPRVDGMIEAAPQGREQPAAPLLSLHSARRAG